MTGRFARVVVLAAVIACTLPSLAHAQQIKIDVDRALAAASAPTQPPYGRSQVQARWHCCSKKGALIGAAVGAGLGVWLARFADCRDCGAGIYFTGAAMVGALGAGVGAFAGPSLRGPIAYPIARIRF